MRTIVLKKIPKIIAKIMFVVCIGILAMGLLSVDSLPATLFSGKAQDITLNTPLPLVAKAGAPVTDGGYQASVNLFGVIPIAKTRVELVGEDYVMVSGSPFGIKMMAGGVLVVGFGDVQTQNGPVNPAKKAGLKEGDLVLAMNGTTVSTNTQMQAFAAQSKGEPITLSVQRKGKSISLTITPVLATDGAYRLGMWVRDSAAGLGTLTFYHPATGMYGGLGHAVCDSTTGDVVSLLTGEIVAAEVLEIEKAVAGKAGSLVGTLNNSQPLGTVLENSNCGVFGQMTQPPQNGQTMRVARKQEVQTGSARILCYADGQLRSYACEIEKIDLKDATQNLVIKVTDPELLAITGGIVQGMSGSPIVQNGVLVGAVTHVFVNQPEKGYGVFAETMLERAQNVWEASNAPLQNAS